MTAPRIEFICIGTELLTGKVNTHTGYLGPKLSEAGLNIAREHAVGDDPSIMRETFREAFKRSDVVISAGGLGPTFDDITREVWSSVLNRPLKKQPWIVDDIKMKFQARGLPMPPRNRRQALVLKGADVLGNPFGTAPGQLVRVGKKTVVLLPGPGRELYPMVETHVLPRLKEIFPGRFLIQKVYLIFGVPESRVDEMIRPWVARRQRVKGCRVVHGILASQLIISVKFTVEGKNPADVHAVAGQLSTEARKILGDLIFGEGKDTLDRVVGELLRSAKKTIAVAESCTGGSIARLFTENAGASDYFLEGIVTYANTSKMRRLGVKSETLKTVGAVSAKTAKEMAEGIRKSSGAAIGLSVTGVAGPTGGTFDKPVGLVYIGLAGARGTDAQEFRFKGDRGSVRNRASLVALDLVRKALIAGSI